VTTVAQRIDVSRQLLTPAERRVADVVLLHPQSVAFGTVADLACRAMTSGATVVRLAAKLGYTGFTELQDAVQGELTKRLRPAAERIREAQPSDALGRTLAVELDNVHATLEGVDSRTFEAAVQRLADLDHPIGVLAGEASRGVGIALADALGMLRPGVNLLEGNEMKVARGIGALGRSPTLITIDFKRYERWVLRFAELAASRSATIISLTDSALSPLADLAKHTFVVRMEGGGPFDSHVGTLALTNALVAGVAARLQVGATDRLDEFEAAWKAANTLVDD
jgi:DNA-binding MurR/RpiR family transcriptional regulator